MTELLSQEIISHLLIQSGARNRHCVHVHSNGFPLASDVKYVTSSCPTLNPPHLLKILDCVHGYGKLFLLLHVVDFNLS
jgi:hypothetical protein